MRQGLCWASPRFASIARDRAAIGSRTAVTQRGPNGTTLFAMECKHGGWSSSLITSQPANFKVRAGAV